MARNQQDHMLADHTQFIDLPSASVSLSKPVTSAVTTWIPRNVTQSKGISY